MDDPGAEDEPRTVEPPGLAFQEPHVVGVCLPVPSNGAAQGRAAEGVRLESGRDRRVHRSSLVRLSKCPRLCVSCPLRLFGRPNRRQTVGKTNTPGGRSEETQRARDAKTPRTVSSDDGKKMERKRPLFAFLPFCLPGTERRWRLPVPSNRLLRSGVPVLNRTNRGTKELGQGKGRNNSLVPALVPIPLPTTSGCSGCGG